MRQCMVCVTSSSRCCPRILSITAAPTRSAVPAKSQPAAKPLDNGTHAEHRRQLGTSERQAEHSAHMLLVLVCLARLDSVVTCHPTCAAVSRLWRKNKTKNKTCVVRPRCDFVEQDCAVVLPKHS